MDTTTRRRICEALLEISELDQPGVTGFLYTFCQMIANIAFGAFPEQNRRALWKITDEQFLKAATDYRDRLQAAIDNDRKSEQ